MAHDPVGLPGALGDLVALRLVVPVVPVMACAWCR
jgi:hypothetical protein